MKKNIGLALVVVSLLLASCQTKNLKETKKQTYLIMLSADGFRWDYPDAAHTPVLDSLQKVGVKAQSMKASFPTKTFPNHYTIATGLYPDHHGIVLNSFYADDLGKEYSIFNREAVSDGSFYGGEPIWITAVKQGMKSATLFWVGSEAPTDGLWPTYWKPYDHDMPYYDRIDTLVKWLNYTEEKRPQLICWYLDEPDSKGHHFGPNGKETIAEVESIDSLLGVFFTQMRKLPFFDQINFIITSDHGMAEVSPDRRVILDELIDTSKLIRFDGWNPNYNLKVKPGYLEEVFISLKNDPNIDVWKHGELPDRLHYGKNIRTQDITLVAKPGRSVYWSWNIGKSLGAHGFDNELKDMHAIFYAAGPAFKKGYLQPTFNNVDIYPLISEIMGFIPARTDGNLDHVKSMLVK